MAKIYISGAITNLDPKVASANFAAAEAIIEQAGHTPLNPLKLVDQTPGRHYNEYLADALRILLLEAEGIFMAEGWWRSAGAIMEQFIARGLPTPLPIYWRASELPIGIDGAEGVILR